ncbi:MAG: DUF5658 family protein [Phycisphaerales bacterium]|nr:DUF5658 family protein [Phycisphaerales bacterium]
MANNESNSQKVMGVHFPNLYLWLVFLSALDVVLTRVILFFNGTELNPLAAWIIDRGGQLGMSIFKFVIVTFVIIICEYTVRADPKMARRLALAGCLITAVPVVWSSFLLIELITTFEPGVEPTYPGNLDIIFEQQDAGSSRDYQQNPAAP